MISGIRSIVSLNRMALPIGVAAVVLVASAAAAQQDPQGRQQPAPYTAPQTALPAVPQAPGQQAVPGQQQPTASPDAPLPRPDGSSVDLRDVEPLTPELPGAVGGNSQTQQVRGDSQLPRREAPAAFQTSPIRLIAPYRAAHVPELPTATSVRIDSLVRDGKLYLSLHDAVALAVENNLDVEVSRYNLLLADTDLTRARGGGNLRGIDYTITQTAPGVGAQTSPLLNAATDGTTAATAPQVTDLSQITQAGNTVQQSLSQTNGFAYAPGPQTPLFDPVVTGQAGYLRRSDQKSLESTTTTGSGTGTGTGSGGTNVNTPPLDFVNTGVDYQQGFSFGAQIEAFVSNAPQVLYANNSQYNPFHAPSTNFTFTQSLLRGRGRQVNLRFVRIARLDQQVSRLLFEQQLLETVYGISRLYYDLVSLGENIGVREDALAAAERLFRDDQNQVAEGTLAPIELTRVQALLAASRLDLIQARGEYRQQEVILRQNLLRRLSDPGAQFASIVPTDHIDVPDAPPQLDVPRLTSDALATRPDLLQAGIQVQANEIAARGTANAVKPLLNVYANVQTRGSSLVPYQLVGSPGTGVATTPAALTQGGLRLSTIYQGGIQLNLPLRNRIAQADAARDQVQLRQSQGRAAKLENDVRQQVENATVALENAHQAYAAAVESRNYQQQLLQAEIDKFSVGASTNYLIVQDEAYLAQARATEVAARSDYQKAQLALDRALGDLLQKNGIAFDDAVQGRVADHP
ncbi:TolC family protein [Terriglobus aquaticus]|uniref:TolC family protein n=1 Tax=Terriglobus aquaticus TaxID=940139 RepID=A0ABW9KIG9_9BACT|nr:TolC family protein [Terriglobus aquaticus]